MHHNNEHSQQHCWHNLKTHFPILVFGQAVCLLGSATSAAQSQLSLQCNWSAPGFSVFLFYACLTFFLVPLHRSQKKAHVRLQTEDNIDDNIDIDNIDIDNNDHHTEETTATTTTNTPQRYLFLNTIYVQAPPWFYMIMGSLDVAASFCIVSALNFTNITSVSLLTALSIPTTMVLSCVFLKRRYQLWHYVGVALCLFGILCRVGQDYHYQQQEEAKETIVYPHKFGGDLLACMGGMFFGINNVLGEVAVQQLGGPLEFLGMMGFFASILAFVYAMIFERAAIAALSDICSMHTSILLLLAYVSSNLLGYYGGAHFLQVSEATFFNLSFQTGSLWSVLFSIFGQHIYPDPFFYVSLVITVSGVVVYEMATSPHREPQLPASPDPVSTIHLRELS